MPDVTAQSRSTVRFRASAPTRGGGPPIKVFVMGEKAWRDEEVAGPVRPMLRAAGSAAGTDLTAMFLEVGPRGCAHDPCDRILRARYRSAPTAERLPPLAS